MKCVFCGSEIPSGSEFCPLCGAWNTPLPEMLNDEDYRALESESLKSPIERDLEEFAEAYMRQIEGASMGNQREEAVEVVRPEMVARWREWGVPEDIIQKAIMQRIHATELRRTEEMVTVEGFAYPMPRLPHVEAEPWGTAKSIDFEGTIIVRQPFVADRIRKIDRWLYRWEYYRPRIGIKTRTYELIEEIANMWHTTVTIRYVWDIRLRAYALDYETHAASARAVRICLLTQPYLTHPEKKRRATEILTLYRERPSIPRPKPKIL